jgi:hypothetical protein
MDPHGYAVPLGDHIRRMNPRDTAVNMNRRRIIRRGGTYGPPLPEGAAEDGAEREQEAAADEIEAVREWLTREGTCLVLGPHHDVGISSDLKARAMEYAHHGDALVPRQQRFGKYTRS